MDRHPPEFPVRSARPGWWRWKSRNRFPVQAPGSRFRFLPPQARRPRRGEDPVGRAPRDAELRASAASPMVSSPSVRSSCRSVSESVSLVTVISTSPELADSGPVTLKLPASLVPETEKESCWGPSGSSDPPQATRPAAARMDNAARSESRSFIRIPSRGRECPWALNEAMRCGPLPSSSREGASCSRRRGPRPRGSVASPT